MSQGSFQSAGNSIAVIGGGIIGVSIAWRLAESGYEVNVFDRGSIGGEASWAGAGMLSLGGEIERPSLLASLSKRSRAMYSDYVRDLVGHSGRSIDYQECGALDLAYSADELIELEARADRQRALDINSKIIAPDQIGKFWPRVRTEGLKGARFYAGDAVVNPRDVMDTLKVVCARANVAMRAKCAVSAIKIQEDGVLVHSEAGTETFDAAVLAAGAWSSRIGVTGVPTLPAVEPIRGHLIGYQQPEQVCNTILRRGHTYVLQRANGFLVAGASVENVGFDRAVSAEIVRNLAKEAGFLLPHLAETDITEAWIGFRPASEDVRLGSWHSSRLFLAYGHYRNGILLAPVTAERVVDEINASLRKPQAVHGAHPSGD